VVFDYNVSALLTAVPATGSHFVGWNGDCSGTGTCTLSMTQGRSAAAVFDLDTEQFSLTVTGNGSVASGDTLVSCDNTNGPGCSATYHYGDTVTLTANPISGYHLASWTDPACADPTAPCTLALKSATTLNLAFNPNVHTVTVTLTGTGGGVLASLESPTP